MQSSITTDLQNLFSYAFIERVPYHFIVPKKNNYLELAISERHNCCLSCNNNFITTTIFISQTTYYINYFLIFNYINRYFFYFLKLF